MLAKVVTDNKVSSSLLKEIRDLGILPPPQRMTPMGPTPISHRKNELGALLVYAACVALKPYYDEIRVAHVNGNGVDLICIKNGIPDYMEAKNWNQRYATGPALTPSKYKHEVKTRFPKHTKCRKILITSATWLEDVGKMMREDDIHPYWYIHQITNRQTFNEAIAEIRYQHELRLWKDEEERRLFNITDVGGEQSSVVDAVDVNYIIVDVSGWVFPSTIVCDPYYSELFLADFKLYMELLHRRRKNEMEVYYQMVYPVTPWTLKWLNQLDVDNQIRSIENQK